MKQEIMYKDEVEKTIFFSRTGLYKEKSSGLEDQEVGPKKKRENNLEKYHLK